ncbi:hypothetical protein ACFWCA_40200 [Streptomyces phaeochromogenes]|uniref:hypothetical protein n=1 Tax=Streptomyces phaeochromogenes TaxID=1923 RepID=UPI0036C961EE
MDLVDTQVAIVTRLRVTGQGGDESVASVSARLFLAVERVGPAERANAHTGGGRHVPAAVEYSDAGDTDSPLSSASGERQGALSTAVSQWIGDIQE